MKLSEIPLEVVQEAVEKMQAEDELVDTVKRLERRVYLLEEIVGILSHDLNARLKRKNASKP